MNNRARAVCLALLAGAGAVSAACAAGTFGSPTSPTDTSSQVSTLQPGTPLAYTQDIKPILDSDCVRCHGSRGASAGIDLSSYAAVMRSVTAGSASSRLVVTTSPGGAMYGQLTGNRATKSATIKAWVLAGAPQNR